MFTVHVLKMKDRYPELLKGIESGQKEFFKSLIDLQSKLAHSIEKGQLGFPDLVPHELDTHENVAVIG